MFFVPPLSCANVGDVDNIAQINFVGKEFDDGGAVTFVAKKDSAVTINGKPNQPVSKLKVYVSWWNQIMKPIWLKI